MQEQKMRELLGMRRAFVVRYSEHSGKSLYRINCSTILYEFYYTKYTRQCTLKLYNLSLHATYVRIHDRRQTD